MLLKQHLDALDGDSKKRAHDFVSHVVNVLRDAVQASDIQAVRDMANELEENRDQCVEALTGGGPSHEQRTQAGGAQQQADAAKRAEADAAQRRGDAQRASAAARRTPTPEPEPEPYRSSSGIEC